MDGEAASADQANALALAKIATIIHNLKIPAIHRTYIEKTIGVIGPNHNLHSNANGLSPSGAVVEVNTLFTGHGHAKYTLHVMLDVDIPPPKSTQSPHLGFEVKLDGARVGNGHIWLPADVLKASRPAPGTPLETYGYNISGLEESHPLPKDLSLEVSYRRYK